MTTEEGRMASQPLISVRGQATLEVEPEIAVISVWITARDRDRRHALELLAKRGEQVAALLRQQGEAVEKTESQPARVRPELKDDKARERIAGYLATGGFTITVRDFIILGDLVAALADQEMATISGPSWHLRRDSQVYRKARMEAVQDAMRRAHEYAAAFGGKVTGLVEVADTGLLAEGVQPAPGAVTMHASLRSRTQPELPHFDFEPAMQTVGAQVEARFTMSSPDFGA